ncbi:endo-1,4-beta-xylanase [Paenibacillus glycanilyticus]|uniref:Beta-xylanase n=1 Tax=Paenibacillus glycanilyticus TaxID=126569 RepID=A0ABQ6GN71_9BACL|nr:endo-1,4-beta-xylanase [Paenibacillus glycanilyticus]GLX71530.1 hypothetical protein MU1_58800 [Paenibacillus glycanilyticus]
MYRRTRRFVSLATSLLLAATLALGAGPVPTGTANAEESNLIVNGDFADGTTGWTTWGADWSADGGIAKMQPAQGGIVQENLPLAAGATYKLSMDVKLGAKEGAERYFFFAVRTNEASPVDIEGTKYETYVNAADDAGMDWQTIEKTFTAPSTLSASGYRLELWGLGSERDIDHVQLVRTGEGSGSEPLELLQNGDFESGLDHWGVSTISPAEAEVTASGDSPLTGAASFYANIAKGGSANWNVQALQVVPADKTLTYTLRFKAKAEKPGKVIGVDIQENGGSWTRYMDTTFELTTDVQSYEYTFKPADTDLKAALNFFVGEGANSVWLDDVSLMVSGIPSDGKTLYASGFEDGLTTGWAPAGAPALSNSEAEAHEGQKSMLVSGRTENWQGAQYDLLGKALPGTTYVFTYWVKPVGSVASTDEMVITLTRDSGEGPSYERVAAAAVQEGEWTKISGDYQIPSLTSGASYSTLNVKLDSAIGTFDYYVDEASITLKPPSAIQNDIPSMWEVYADKFPIGASVEPRDLEGGNGELVSKHYNSMTLENSMKMNVLEASKDVYNFTSGDTVAQYALESGKKLRGHALVWHASTPDWVFRNDSGGNLSPDNPADVQLVDSRLKTYIETVVKHYEEMDHAVYAWDVVNEAIDESQPDGFRRSPWYEFFGPDYIAKAFTYAHDADMEDGHKDLELFYNDYNEYDPKKRALILNMLQGLKDQGVPIDGFGMQMHIGLASPSVDAISKTIDMYSALGLKVQATELDVNVFDVYPLAMDSLTPEADAALGYRYKALFDVFKEKAAEGKFQAVTFWNIHDGRSWLNAYIQPLNKSHPLPFDRNLQAKGAYWGIVDPTKLPALIREAKAADVAAVNDGLEDEGYRYLAATKLPSIQPVSFRAVWDAGHLSLFVHVSDATVDQTDKVEVFVDPDNSDNAFDPLKDMTAVHERGGEAGEGYNAEFAIPVNGLRLGQTLGLDIRVTDGENVFSWNDAANAQETSTSNYGNLTLSHVQFTTAVQAKNKPVIDGLADASWEKAVPVTTDVAVSSKEGTTAAKGTFRAMWSEDGLYVLADVKDPLLNKDSVNSYEQDSIEVFLDENNAKTSEYEEAGDAQYRINYNNEYNFNGKTLNSAVQSATSLTDDGYIVETFIPFQTVSRAEAGMLLGYDVQVNDADETGKRINTRTWSGAADNGWRSTTDYGVLKLASGVDENSGGGSTGGAAIPVTADVHGDSAILKLNADVIGKLLDGDSKVIHIEAKSSGGNASSILNENVQIPASLIAKATAKGKTLVLKLNDTVFTIEPGTFKLSDNAQLVELHVAKMPFADAAKKNAGLPSQGATPAYAYEFGLEIDGQKLSSFEKPLGIQVLLDESERSKQDKAGAYTFNETTGKWDYIGGHAVNGMLTFATAHFSAYAVVVNDKTFSDIASHWAKAAIERLASRWIATGLTETKFAPDQNVTRAEFAALLVRALGMKEANASASFTDIGENDWYRSYAEAAADNGVLLGNGAGQFVPNQAMTREEMAVSIIRAYHLSEGETRGNGASVSMFSDQSAEAPWARASIQEAVSLGLLQGYPDHTFRPKETLSRAEAAVALTKLIDLIGQ